MCVNVHMNSPILPPPTKSVVGVPGNPNAVISEVQTFFSEQGCCKEYEVLCY